MFFKPTAYLFALVGLIQHALSAHGDGAEGTVMGPVAFLWPSDRPWASASDNIAPCGSVSPPSNRTSFPIGSIGSIELTIADDAYNLAVRIAYGNNPTTQQDFQAVKSNVSELEPGHQCYPLPNESSAVTPGSNATIQLEYWANDNDKEESFFACADIVFVEAVSFATQVPCFNVTADEFVPASTSSSSVPTSIAAGQATASPTGDRKDAASGGLSGGAKAGIVVGSIFGAALFLAAVFFAIRRKGGSGRDAEAMPALVEKNAKGSDGASVMSGKTAS
ncbi:hypothetical protein BGZ57DRAFT_765775 [Hyaloscypha finlandica]|nr:hypothetical protein BGZ57DRAFT_765775 [Hyaloscypha finlandica]